MLTIAYFPENAIHYKRNMKKNPSLPCLQLGALAGVHFFVDMIGGTLPGFLPAVLERFQISIGTGALLIACIGIGSNLLQMPAAKLAARCTSNIVLLIGMALAGAFVLIGVLPATTPIWALCLLLLLSGFGTALVHPTGLRGVGALPRPEPAVATPFFMIGGFLGFSAAPWIGAVLVQKCGFPGLLWLLLPGIVVASLVVLSRVRLDRPAEKTAKTAPQPELTSPWSFRRLLVIAFFLNSGTLTIGSLLPTVLVDKGFSASFGGLSAMLFGFGSAVGSLAMGFLSKKIHPAKLIVWSLALGTPAVFLYLIGADLPGMAAFALFAGALASSSFPQIVALTSAISRGAKQGSRLAWIVGGSWGAAGVLFLGVGQLASRFGLGMIYSGCLFFALALGFALLFPEKKSFFRKSVQ